MPTPQREAIRTTREFFSNKEGLSAPGISVLNLPDSDRAQMIRHWCRFADGKQHDHRNINWSGGYRDPGVGYMHARMEPMGFVPTSNVPYGDRRPDTPDPLGVQIVNRFADMLASKGAFPSLAVPSDPETTQYLHAVTDRSNTQATFHEARKLSGACGEAAILLEIVDGVPTTEVLQTANLDVEFKPGAGWIPVQVVEQKIVEIDDAVITDGRVTVERKRYWRTRFWNEEIAASYPDVPEDYGSQKEDQDENGNPKPIPPSDIVEHGAGRCPVHWLQNTRNTEHSRGQPDLVCEAVLELLDQIDKLSSMGTRASVAGTDPTLVLKRDMMQQRRGGLIRKGYGQKIEVGKEGDAKFLEISGETIRVNWESADKLRDMVMQTCACVVIDPKTSGSEKSGEAVQMLWRSMEDRCDSFRTPLETTILEVSQTWIALGRHHGVTYATGPNETDGDGGILLPPNVVEDEDNRDKPPTLSAFNPGAGWFVKTQWPPYHRPTALQVQSWANGLSTATGQKPVISQKTAVEVFGGVIGRTDSDEEYDRIAEETEERTSRMEAIMGAGAPGGGDDDGDGDDPTPPEPDDKSGDGDGDDQPTDTEKE